MWVAVIYIGDCLRPRHRTLHTSPIGRSVFRRSWLALSRSAAAEDKRWISVKWGVSENNRKGIRGYSIVIAECIGDNALLKKFLKG
jgi:hypothetical protein